MRTVNMHLSQTFCVLPHVFKQRNAPIISCIVLYLLLNSEHCLIKADANWMKT